MFRTYDVWVVAECRDGSNPALDTAGSTGTTQSCSAEAVDGGGCDDGHGGSIDTGRLRYQIPDGGSWLSTEILVSA